MSDEESEKSSIEKEEFPIVKQEFQPLMLDKFLDLFPDMQTNGDYSFTGVWHSARAFLDFLRHDYPVRGRILELGAGTGWLGITLAQHLGDECQKMALSDRKGTWLEANLEEAENQGIPCANVTCLGMDWSRKSSVKYVGEMGWDYIIGSDLVYSEEGVRHLAGAIGILANIGSPRIIYAHTLGRIPELDEQWETELKSRDLAWTVLAKKPLVTTENKVWEGRSTLIMYIYPTREDERDLS